jgi:hypothetical protein
VIGFGYSNAFIFNAHQDPALLTGISKGGVSHRDSPRTAGMVIAVHLFFNPDGNMAALRAILDGIIQQVDTCSANPALIYCNFKRS